MNVKDFNLTAALYNRYMLLSNKLKYRASELQWKLRKKEQHPNKQKNVPNNSIIIIIIAVMEHRIPDSLSATYQTAIDLNKNIQNKEGHSPVVRYSTNDIHPKDRSPVVYIYVSKAVDRIDPANYSHASL